MCSSSWKFHGRVQSSTTTTAVWGKGDCGSRKCDTRAAYEGADGGTVNTDNRARMMQYAGVNGVRDAFMGDKGMKDLLLPHRIHRPSHILRQSMCVAHLVLRPVVSRSLCSSCGSRSGKCFTRGASMMTQSWSSRFGLRTNGTGMREKLIPARKNLSSVTTPASLHRSTSIDNIKVDNLTTLIYCTRMTTSLCSVDKVLCIRPFRL